MPHSVWEWFGAIVWWLLAYGVGSLPFGVWIARGQGKDLRAEGSGNVGATNAFRVLGPWFGILIFVLDMLKGAVPVLAAARMFGGESFTIVVTATAAVCGHVWSCLLDFRGGKGVATMFGALVGVNVAVAILVLVVWAVAIVVFRYVSVASLIAITLTGHLLGIAGHTGWYVIWALAMLALGLYTHRENIDRLRRGTEIRLRSGAKSG